jgi:hypothetical protein
MAQRAKRIVEDRAANEDYGSDSHLTIPPAAQCVVPDCSVHLFSDERQEFPTKGGHE